MSASIFPQVILIGIALLDFLVAAFILWKNSKHIVHRTFFVFVSGAAIWVLGIAFLSITKFFILDKVIFYGGTVMILGLVLFAKTFPDGGTISRRFWLALTPFIGIFIAIPFNVFIKGLVPTPGGTLQPINGPAFPVFAITMGAYFVFSISLFVKKYIASSGLARLQIQYLFLGTAVFAAGVLWFDIILPYFGIFYLNLFGPATSLVLVISVAYSISRYNLLDIRSVIQSGFLYLLTSAAVIGLCLFLIVTAGRFLNERTGAAPQVSAIFSAVIIVIAFPYLRNVFRRLVGPVFLKGHYDPNLLLSELTHIMAGTIDLSEMTEGLLQVLIRKLQLTKAAFIIADRRKITYMRSIGYPRRFFSLSDLQLLFSRPQPHLIFEELEEGPAKDLFRRSDVAVTMPIRVGGKESAMLVMGPKTSGDIFYRNDIALLDLFISEAGIAIQNAKAYLQIKEFSQKLEQRVRERTRELRDAQEEELANAQEILRLKDEFVFLAVHELRTPITVIHGFLELTAADKAKLPASVQRNFAAISLASEGLKRLVDNLLEIARSEEGKLTVRPEAHEFKAILDEVVAEVMPLIEEKKIKLNVNVQPLPLLWCDVDKTKEVLLNLVGNAIKYNRVNGVIAVNAYRHPAEPSVIFEIRDSGFGIPPDQQAHIFQKFFRADTKNTHEVAGSGLGLFITRMLVEKMGGVIDFSSVEDKGTTFTFTLPFASALQTS
ncbi:MAG: hypothetical protein HY617_01825 [Candidatus Sungbacteria bacterium]|nr:hypothetical protein [Candidatus Sungbacteria bacterium]